MKTLLARFLTVAFAVGAFIPQVKADSILAPFTGGNSNDGIMFDIVGVKSVQLTGVQLAIDTTGFINVEVYQKADTWQGFEATPAAWTKIFAGQTFVTTASTAPSSLILFNSPVFIAAGSRAALYVTTTGGGPRVEYTNGTSVPPNFTAFATNSDLQIFEGSGSQYPFASTNQPRNFNGVIYYSFFTPTPTPAPTPTISLSTSARVTTTKKRVKIQGTATNASSVSMQFTLVRPNGTKRKVTQVIPITGSSWATFFKPAAGRNVVTLTARKAGASSGPLKVIVIRK